MFNYFIFSFSQLVYYDSYDSNRHIFSKAGSEVQVFDVLRNILIFPSVLFPVNSSLSKESKIPIWTVT